MENTIKTISIELLAEKLGGKLWTKGELKRIYIDAGYNTKKMSTKTYVFEKDAKFFVKCDIECPSQNGEWIYSQQQRIVESLTEKIEYIVEEFGSEIENPQIAIEAAVALEEQVQGYWMEWKEVRVAINSFGKLATRKRMFVVAFKGPKSKAHPRFIELTDEDYAIALEKEKSEIAYEYGNEPTIVGEAARLAAYKADQEAKRILDEENARIANEKKLAEEAKIKKENAAKVEALKASGLTDVLVLWKAEGCQHPAPAEVAEAKRLSGLGWNAFIKNIGNATN